MHVLIKIIDAETRALYENHSSFHEGDSGLDIFSPEDVIIPPRSKGIINTGVACEATIGSNGTSFWMLSRSSVATKTPLLLCNSIGLIDAGYRGHLMGVFYNTSDEPFVVEKGSRLLQICAPDLKPVTFELVDTLSSTSRGTGGYGSTGN
jgi:dUTP pyrophosphatase